MVNEYTDLDHMWKLTSKHRVSRPINVELADSESYAYRRNSGYSVISARTEQLLPDN